VSRTATRLAVSLACVLATVLAAAPPAAADTTRDRQWHLAFLNVAEAHKLNQGSGVVVAVVDTGVNGNHPDLVGNVLPGADVSGVGTPNALEDLVGHGTGMASLIAGHGHGAGNGEGALGIAPQAKVLAVRVTHSNVAVPDTLAAGIDVAVRSGAKVISLSLAGSNSPRLRQSIDAALAADAVVVAGMGNRPDDVLPGYPAVYPGVVAVGATGQDGNVGSISVTGPQMVLSAPGMRIVSADPIGYAIGDGTSASTAIVAGAAALVRSKYPSLSAREVVHRLTATATDKGAPGRDPQYGFGIVNLVGALTADVPPASPSAAPPSAGDPVPASTGPAAAVPPAGGNGNGIGSAVPLVLALLAVVLAVAGAAGWLLLRRRRAAVGSPTATP
jgi:type VII secretion-associated serine protease mycosin